MLRHQNGIFFGTNGISTGSETPFLTENTCNTTRLSFSIQCTFFFNVRCWTSTFYCVLAYSYSHLHYFSCHLLCHGLRKKIQRLIFFSITGGYCFWIKNDPIIKTPWQAKRVTNSFYLAIYWQIPLVIWMPTRVHWSKLSKVKLLGTVPTHYQLNKWREKSTYQLGTSQIT